MVFLGVSWTCWLVYIWFWKPVRREPWCDIKLGDTDALETTAVQELFRYTSKPALGSRCTLNHERKGSNVTAFKQAVSAA
mmetsp:Transcript_37268/g.46039  ORF Transcript_37268/g.46039 Transcript_37268/m.46039 type:complete len:80 (+) Transcript_37268:1-240(+)